MNTLTHPMSVSVVTAVRNAREYIGKTVASVLSQTYDSFEYIIIDDNSTDGTTDILHCAASRSDRVRLIENETNLGTSYSRNKAVSLARGDIIAFIDGDDVWESDKLLVQTELMQKTGAGLVYCSYDFIDLTGTTVGRPYIVPEQTDFTKMLGENVIGCSAAIVKADIIRGYDFSPEYLHEDYQFWMRLLADGVKAVGSPRVLMHYRVLKDSRSADKLASARERYRIYRKALKLPRGKSVAALLRYAYNGLKKYRRL